MLARTRPPLEGLRFAATHSRCACEANPDHDSTLKFGVAISGWCISHVTHGVGRRITGVRKIIRFRVRQWFRGNASRRRRLSERPPSVPATERISDVALARSLLTHHVAPTWPGLHSSLMKSCDGTHGQHLRQTYAWKFRSFKSVCAVRHCSDGTHPDCRIGPIRVKGPDSLGQAARVLASLRAAPLTAEFRWVRSQTVMTILPRAWPSIRWRMAVATSLRG